MHKSKNKNEIPDKSFSLPQISSFHEKIKNKRFINNKIFSSQENIYDEHAVKQTQQWTKGDVEQERIRFDEIIYKLLKYLMYLKINKQDTTLIRNLCNSILYVDIGDFQEKFYLMKYMKMFKNDRAKCSISKKLYLPSDTSGDSPDEFFLLLDDTHDSLDLNRGYVFDHFNDYVYNNELIDSELVYEKFSGINLNDEVSNDEEVGKSVNETQDESHDERQDERQNERKRLQEEKKHTSLTLNTHINLKFIYEEIYKNTDCIDDYISNSHHVDFLTDLLAEREYEILTNEKIFKIYLKEEALDVFVKPKIFAVLYLICYGKLQFYKYSRKYSRLITNYFHGSNVYGWEIYKLLHSIFPSKNHGLFEIIEKVIDIDINLKNYTEMFTFTADLHLSESKRFSILLNKYGTMIDLANYTKIGNKHLRFIIYADDQVSANFYVEEQYGVWFFDENVIINSKNEYTNTIPTLFSVLVYT